MRRSGNHAIIEWIASHFLSTIHHNDCSGWKQVHNYSKHFYGCMRCERDLLIRSYEDFYPSLEELNDSRTIVILRDWYNMMSSRLVTKRDYVKNRHDKFYKSKKVVETWLEYAKLYKDYPNKFILYNKWVEDAEYRLSVQKNFGLDDSRDRYTSAFPESKVGHGSSFDKDKLNLCAVNERYKLLKLHHPDLYKSLNNAEVNGYCEDIFGLNIFALKFQ